MFGLLLFIFFIPYFPFFNFLLLFLPSFKEISIFGL